jgi:hypothetical protein
VDLAFLFPAKQHRENRPERIAKGQFLKAKSKDASI